MAVKKTRASGTWTEARYFGFIRSALRQAWMKYPVKHHALELSRRPYTGSDKRTKWEHQCNHCKEWYKAKDVQVDHIQPAGTLREYSHLPTFVKRLFCELDNLQVLCSTCHDKKTQEDKRV